MRKLALVCVLLLLFSCKEISFKEPQPRGKKALKEIPKSLTGTYLLSNEKESDTLIVTSTRYYALSDKKESVLGDSLVLKKFKGYYFVNINDDPEWLLRIIKQEKNGDLIYMEMDDGNSWNDFIAKLSKEIKIDSVEVKGGKLYQIDPSPKQLVGFIEKGFFKQKMQMKKLK